MDLVVYPEDVKTIIAQRNSSLSGDYQTQIQRLATWRDLCCNCVSRTFPHQLVIVDSWWCPCRAKHDEVMVWDLVSNNPQRQDSAVLVETDAQHVSWYLLDFGWHLCICLVYMLIVRLSHVPSALMILNCWWTSWELRTAPAVNQQRHYHASWPNRLWSLPLWANW